MKRRLCALLTLILAILILLTGCELPDSSSQLFIPEAALAPPGDIM